MRPMAIEYRVYDPQKNEFLVTQSSEEEAIASAESIAAPSVSAQSSALW